MSTDAQRKQKGKDSAEKERGTAVRCCYVVVLGGCKNVVGCSGWLIECCKGIPGGSWDV